MSGLIVELQYDNTQNNKIWSDMLTACTQKLKSTVKFSQLIKNQDWYNFQVQAQ